MNWLRVFRSAEASRLGHGVSQPLHARAVRSEKCAVLRDGCGTGMCVIAAFFACVLRRCTGRVCIDFLLILQEVRQVCKTRNQFSVMSVIVSGLSSPDVGVIVARCRGYRCLNFVCTFFSRRKFNRLYADLAKYYCLKRSIRSIASRLASWRPGVC